VFEGTFKWARSRARGDRGVAALGALAGLAVLAFGAVPAEAHPDTNAEAASLCGAGYHVVNDPDGTPARRPVKTSGGAVFGHVYLTYNNNTRKNCVVTIKSRFHGQATFTGAYLAVEGRNGSCGVWFCDEGNFGHFAGGPPNYRTTIAAGGRCVAYYAYMWSGPNRTGTFAEGGRLRMANCGG
jgi:hypothetical protein